MLTAHDTAPGQGDRGRSMRRKLSRRGFLNVVDVVDGERTHQDTQRVDVGACGVLGDLVLTEASSLEGLAVYSLDRAGREQVGHVVGQVAKVDEAPEGKFRCASVLSVFEHLAQDAQSGHLDLVTEPFVLKRLRSG